MESESRPVAEYGVEPVAAPSAEPGLEPMAEPLPVAPVIPKKPVRRGGSTALNALLGLAVIVAVGGLAFAAGRLTAPAAAATNTGFPAGTQPFTGGPLASGAPGGFRGVGLTGAIAGTVTAVTPTEITLTTDEGTEIHIPVDRSTKYHEQADASADDVTVGSDVLVQLADGGGTGGPRGPIRAPGASPAPGATPVPVTLGTASDVTVTPR